MPGAENMTFPNALGGVNEASTVPDESATVTASPAAPVTAALTQPWPSVEVGVSTISFVDTAMTVPPVMVIAPLESSALFAPELGP